MRSGVRDRLLDRGWKRELTFLGRRERVYSIRVAQGCLGECTYCAIKFAAGPRHSKPLRTLLAKFDAGLARGYTQFRLIAGDLGCYGQDIGTNVVDLLSAMMARSPGFQLTLLDFDLKWFIVYSDALVDLYVRHHAHVRSLLLPMQSGSERILQRMRRGHTTKDARRVLMALREACPDMTLESHVLVGFPGETERDFEDTKDLLRAVRFDRVHFYDYQDRPGTEASAMPEKVSRDVIEARSQRARREFGGRWAALEYKAQKWDVPLLCGRRSPR